MHGVRGQMCGTREAISDWTPVSVDTLTSAVLRKERTKKGVVDLELRYPIYQCWMMGWLFRMRAAHMYIVNARLALTVSSDLLFQWQSVI